MADKTKNTCPECDTDFTLRPGFIKHFTRYHPKHLHIIQTTSTTPSPSTPEVQTPATPAANDATAPVVPDVPAPAANNDPAPMALDISAPVAKNATAPAALTNQLIEDDVDTAAAAAPQQNPLLDNDEEDLTMDSEVMDMWAELHECIEKMTQDNMEPEKDQENKEELNDKVTRFKVIITKKNEIMKQLKIEKANLIHEVDCIKQVIDDKDRSIDEKEKKIIEIENVVKKNGAIVKNFEQQKITMEKDLENIRELNNDIIREKTNLEIDLSTKNFIIQEIKKVRENKEMDEEEVIEITQSTSNITMDKDSSGHVCNFCGKGFKTKQGLERHIQDKHEENCHLEVNECTLCGEGFIGEQEMNSHILKCIKHKIQISNCPSCKANFTMGDLKRHQELEKCRKRKEQHEIRNHSNGNHMDEVKSKTVCRHWRVGNCFRGDKCIFAHVGFQQQPPSNNVTTKSANTIAAPKINCRNGSRCIWLARKRCNFFHQEIENGPQQGVRQIWQGANRMGQGGQQGGQQGGRGGHLGGLGSQQGGHMGPKEGWTTQTKGDCWFQEECKRTLCPYNHRSVMDFPNINNRKNSQ